MRCRRSAHRPTSTATAGRPTWGRRPPRAARRASPPRRRRPVRRGRRRGRGRAGRRRRTSAARHRGPPRSPSIGPNTRLSVSTISSAPMRPAARQPLGQGGEARDVGEHERPVDDAPRARPVASVVPRRGSAGGRGGAGRSSVSPHLFPDPTEHARLRVGRLRLAQCAGTADPPSPGALGGLVQVTFLGVRGSDSARPGASSSATAGTPRASPCRPRAGEPPTLLLDAGHRHAQRDGRCWRRSPFAGPSSSATCTGTTCRGIPFFAAGDRPGARVRMFVPAQGVGSRAGPHRPDDVAAGLPHHAGGTHRRLDVRCRASRAPVDVRGVRRRAPSRWRTRAAARSATRCAAGAAALGVRAGPRPRARRVRRRARRPLHGVDVLVHDAQFLEHERPRAVDYGHATVDDAIRLAERVRAGTVVLFHHGPHRTDDALDDIGRDFTASMPVRRRDRGAEARPRLTCRPRDHGSAGPGVPVGATPRLRACGSCRCRTCTTGCPTTTGWSRRPPTPTSSPSPATSPTS